MRRSTFGVLGLAILIAVTVAGSTRAAGTTVPACTTGAAGTLVPTLADFSVNQGLESYTSTSPIATTVGGIPNTFIGTGRLVRGKETLVRPYLTLPSACTGSITLARASLAATSGGVPLAGSPFSATTGTGTGSIPAAVSASSSVDPVFDIPAAALRVGDGSSTFSVAWTLTLTFTQNKNSTSISQTYGSAPIAPATFEKKTNALRILVVPMGDMSQPYSTQFPASATTDIENAMNVLDRIYPVESGVGSLTAPNGGIDYTIDTAAMVDLRSITGAYDANGRFCGGQANFDAIKASLSQFLQTWNTQNRSATADRVVGAVWGGQNTAASPGISDGATMGCADGMAGINSQVAWVRAIDDNTSGRPATYSFTGGILAMEISHTFGLVPAARSTNFHSQNIAADVVTPTGRAYNITSRTYVANSHSVMRYDTSTSAYDNTDTLLEPQDYNDLLCLLTPGAQTNTECATTGTTGTSTGVGATSMLYGSGTTDGTVAGTHVVETYYAPGTQPLGQCSPSDLHVLQLGGAGPLDTEVCLETRSSDHDADEGPAAINDTTGVFSFAVPADGGANEIQLVDNGTVIYDRRRQAPPTVSFATQNDFGPLTFKAPVIPPTPDILFLADTTGSMGSAISTVQSDLTQAGGIIQSVLAVRSNAAFGAANYRDVACDGALGYVRDQAMTTSLETIQAAVNHWTAPIGAGCDTPEDQLYALHRIATDPAGEGELGTDPGWRPGSTRIVVWFGDSNGHDPSPLPTDGVSQVSLVDAANALVAANVHVIAVPVDTADGNGLETAVFDATLNMTVDQPKYIVQQTGGALQPLTSPADVAQAIIAGLKDLPVTLVPSTSCDDPNITLSVGTQDPLNPVQSGAAVTYSDVSATVGAHASPGIHTCTLSFTANGVPDPALTRTYQVGVMAVTVTATSATPENLRVDLIYTCNGTKYPVAVGLAPTQVSGQTASFSTFFDTSLDCGSTGGTLTPVVTDGFTPVQGASQAPPQGNPPPKPPTAAIYTPFTGPYLPGGDVAYSGTGDSPQTGQLPGSALTWKIGGAQVATGKSGVFTAPAAAGTYTLTLTATDSIGSSTVTTSFDVVAPPKLTLTDSGGGVISPNAVTVTITASDAASGLASVACTVDGVSAAVPAPSGAPGAVYTAQLTLSGGVPHITQCTATANDGLTAAAVDTVGYVFNGFLSPVNNPTTINTGKAGKTYPVKFQLKDTAGHFFSSLAAVTSIQLASVACTGFATDPTDPLEITASGGTVLRYDSTANQYIYNWQTPSTKGCYVLSVSTDDGGLHQAFFNLT